MRQLTFALSLTKDPSQQANICTKMRNVSERALLQVNDLTKIARLEDGLYDMQPVSVRGVCEQVSRDITPLFGYAHKDLRIRYRNRQKLAIANTELLYSLIYNFCTNAMHYSDEHTTSLLTVSDNADKIKIDVRDYGPALPTKIWHDVKAGRLDRPTSIAMRPGSSGLGLYISSRFAEHMHAKLGSVRHHDGVSFYVELPVSHQATLFG